MQRRNFLKNCALGAAATISSPAPGFLKADTADPIKAEVHAAVRRSGPELFPLDTPAKQWTHFDAHGYSRPVCGVIYRLGDQVPHGMPLGGVATGCIDVDTDGTFGFCTLFNSGVPTRGPLQYGFLGISSAGRSWILSSRPLPGVESAKEIHYWGHYPIADVE